MFRKMKGKRFEKQREQRNCGLPVQKRALGEGAAPLIKETG
jgi:hypothetical protein